jgi:ribosomal protein S18 acetylase RimI-like enzyme
MAIRNDDLDRWAVRSLGWSDQTAALEFLEREPIMNAYLVSRILEEGIAGLGDHVAVFLRGELVGIAMVGWNIVMAVERSLPHEMRDLVVSIFADQVTRTGDAPRAIISEVSLVETLWRQIAAWVSPPTVWRDRQPVYVLDDMDDPPELDLVRYSRAGDLDALVPACAAMHLEEVGIDPMARDASGYRQRIRELISQQRSMVLFQKGKLVFKTEFSAVTTQTVQLMGVWTRPEERRHGWAQRGLREICGHLLHRHRRVSLFVNDFNKPAIDLYESIGFRPIGVNRALIW